VCEAPFSQTWLIVSLSLIINSWDCLIPSIKYMPLYLLRRDREDAMHLVQVFFLPIDLLSRISFMYVFASVKL